MDWEKILAWVVLTLASALVLYFVANLILIFLRHIVGAP